METGKFKTGFTLVELLMTLALVTIMVTAVIAVGRRVRTQAEVRLAESTVSILVAALEQYYEDRNAFPPDYQRPYYEDVDTWVEFAESLGGSDINITDNDLPYDREFAAGASLYYFLSRTASSRKILDSISVSLVSAEGPVGWGPLVLTTASGEKVTLLRVIDPWSKALQYRYVPGSNFPGIRSAGPDGKFEMKWDNITSKGK